MAGGCLQASRACAGCGLSSSACCSGDGCVAAFLGWFRAASVQPSESSRSTMLPMICGA